MISLFRRAPKPDQAAPAPLPPLDADRARGLLLGGAVGDALGVPYEAGSRVLGMGETPQMLGGGLGGFAPGEWSDDTAMALGIAAAVMTSRPLANAARNFLSWEASGPSDIGIHTSGVLSVTNDLLGARRVSEPIDSTMTKVAADRQRANPTTAGNGALMRTGPVALWRPHDRDATADLARRMAALTHAHDDCVDSSVLWTEAVRVALTEQRLDIVGGLDLLPEHRRRRWDGLIDDVTLRPMTDFRSRGWTVDTLQAAWAAVLLSQTYTGTDAFTAPLVAVIRLGGDTDTVAAVTGALLGARYGASAIPAHHLTGPGAIHGWPNATAVDLVALADQAVARTDETGHP